MLLLLLLLLPCAAAATNATNATNANSNANTVAARQTVKVDPSQCSSNGDCSKLLNSAIQRCAAAAASAQQCTVELAPGDYRVECPDAPRPSTTQVEAPAIPITGINGIQFGGLVGLPRPQLLIDYKHGGCAAIVVANCSNAVIQHIIIDSYRLPFTVAHVLQPVSDQSSSLRNNGREEQLEVASTISQLRLQPEEAASLSVDRPGIYQWNLAKYSWLDTIYAAQKVVVGTRATRQLPEVGVANIANMSSSADPNTGIITLTFPHADPRRSLLKVGDRLFFKHFDNLQSWGVYGWNVAGMVLDHVSLWSVSGMGLRCDLCSEVFLLKTSDVSIKPGSLRPMSITADAMHFMHHGPGMIKVEDSSLQGQGDDCFNVHGNFIVIDSIFNGDTDQRQLPRNNTSASEAATAKNTVTYIDETGPGWIAAAPTWFVGDQVQFYSRTTLQPILDRANHSDGRGDPNSTPHLNVIVAATRTTVTFRDPLPANVRQYDMFLTMKRVASVDIRNSFFGNSNSRGLVLSAVSTTLINNTFANLSQAAIDFFEGGCGAVGNQADYTEGPFSKDIQVINNTFIKCATVKQSIGAANNGAVIDISGCRPIGQCGLSGFTPFIPSQPTMVPLPPTSVPFAARDRESVGGGISNGAYYSVSVEIPAGAAAVHTLKYAIANGAEYGAALMGLYNSSADGTHATKLLVSVQPTSQSTGSSTRSATIDAAASAEFSWQSGTVTPALSVDAGKYFLVLWLKDWSSWASVATPGNYSSMSMHAGGGGTASRMPESLGRFWGNWTHVRSQGLPIVAEWTPVGDWCSVGGSLPPPIDGMIDSPSQVLQSNTIFSNVTIVANMFKAPALYVPTSDGRPWANPFVVVGNVVGGRVERNTFIRTGAAGEGSSDLELFANVGLLVLDNTCYVSSSNNNSSTGASMGGGCLVRNNSYVSP